MIPSITRSFFLSSLSLLTASGIVAGTTWAETATLHVEVIDAQGEPLPFRGWVRTENEQHFQPHQPETVTPYTRDQSSSCDGWFEMRLPAGTAHLHIEKGKEWLPVDLPVTLEANQTERLTVPLKRWIDMPARGYYSSDLHIHFGNEDPRILAQLAQADDLHLVPAFSFWWRGTEAEWPTQWPDWDSGPSAAIHGSYWITRNNLEIERIASNAGPGGSVGASFLFNLQQPAPVRRFSPRYPTDTALCLLARATSPHVVIDTDKPSWAETVIGAILGAYDTVQVCHNHYHRNRTLPGGWGMIGPLAPHEGSLSDRNELFHRTNQHYYAFLNCGIELGVSGGSAIGVMPVPAGYNRLYAQVSEPFTPSAFWQAVKSGRTFATSGPMLFLSVNEHQPGSRILRSGTDSQPIAIRLEVDSIQSLQTLELIHNGRIIRQWDLSTFVPNPNLQVRQVMNHTPTRSGWYAARTIFESPSGQLRQAHTSPVYLTIDQKPTAFRGDAEYLLRWTQRLDDIAQQLDRFETPEARQQVLATYQRAREAYQRVVEQAKRHWQN